MAIARSADAVTVVVTESELSDGSGSAVVDDTDAAFDNEPAWFGAVTTIVMSGAAPVTSVGRVHVTDTFPAFVHDHPPPDADTNVTPAGSVSTTETTDAVEGPKLVTASV